MGSRQKRRSKRGAARESRRVRAAELARQAGLLRRAGRAGEAVGLLRAAVKLDPRNGGWVGNLGNALFAIGDRAAALVALRKACVLDPSSGILAYNLGRALLDEGDMESSRRAFTRALELGGIEAHARVNLGRLDEIEGDRTSATEQWRAAAAVAPRLARPHYLLARVGALTDRAPLEALVADAETPAEARAEAHFGLGYAFERDGDFARAFAHFTEANRAKRAQLPRFDPAGHEAALERLMQVFDAEFFRRLEPAHASEVPLFLVGMPRSGTTLIETILGAHPAVAARGERTELDDLARRWAASGYPATPAAIPAEERRRAADAYLEALDVPATALRATDKMPGNYVHLGLVAMLFGGARVIHCRRDPLDTALSLYCQLFEGNALPFSYDLAHIARVIVACRRLMEHWRSCSPTPLLAVDYEALVADVEGESRRLVDFAGLDWDARCLARDAGEVLSASAWRVRAPVDASSVGRWRNYAEWLEPLRGSLTEA